MNAFTPEQAIIESLSEEDRKELYSQQEYDPMNSGKTVFKAYTCKALDDTRVSSEDILLTQKRYIARLPKDCQLFQSVENALTILLK